MIEFTLGELLGQPTDEGIVEALGAEKSPAPKIEGLNTDGPIARPPPAEEE